VSFTWDGGADSISFHITIGVVSMHDSRLWIVGGLDPNSLMVYVVLSNLSSFTRTRLAVRHVYCESYGHMNLSRVSAFVRNVKNGSRPMNSSCRMHLMWFNAGVSCPTFLSKVMLQPSTISDAANQGSHTSAILVPLRGHAPHSMPPSQCRLATCTSEREWQRASACSREGARVARHS
jgi:hypothetical protein